jgi:hypothetical protein
MPVAADGRDNEAEKEEGRETHAATLFGSRSPDKTSSAAFDGNGTLWI